MSVTQCESYATTLFNSCVKYMNTNDAAYKTSIATILLIFKSIFHCICLEIHEIIKSF